MARVTDSIPIAPLTAGAATGTPLREPILRLTALLLLFACASSCTSCPSGEWRSWTQIDQVLGMTFDEDGFLWIARRGGVTLWDPRCSTYVTYTTDDGLVDNDVTAVLAASPGVLWFGTGQGVSRFEEDTWTTYTAGRRLVGTYVFSMATAPDGALWLATWDRGVLRFDGDTWTAYTIRDGLGDNSTRSVTVAPDGTLWVGTWAGGAS